MASTHDGHMRAPTLYQCQWPTVIPQPLIDAEPHRVACHEPKCRCTGVFDGFECVDPKDEILKRHMHCSKNHGFWIVAFPRPRLSPTGWRVILPSRDHLPKHDQLYRLLFPDELIIGTTRYQLNHLPASFHPRPNQRELAGIIRGVLEQRATIWVQAGVGFGKTIAYLIPAIQTWWHTPKATRGPLVIATATIALQRQLETAVHDTLKRLEWTIPVLTVQGQSHYWCWQRTQSPSIRLPSEWDTLRRQPHPAGDATALRRDHLPKLLDTQWQTVQVQDTALCRTCVVQSQCGVPALRDQQARAQGILIVNHGVFADDLIRRERGDKPRWPMPQLMIIDEAHQIDATLRSQSRGILSQDVLLRYIDTLAQLAQSLALTNSAWRIRHQHLMTFRATLMADRDRLLTLANRQDDRDREWGWGRSKATERAWADLCSDQSAFRAAERGLRFAWPDALSFWQWAEALVAWGRQDVRATWAITLDRQQWYRTPLPLDAVWSTVAQRPIVFVSGTLTVDELAPVALPGWSRVDPSRRYRFQASSPFDYAHQLRYQWIPNGPSREQPPTDQAAWIAEWLRQLYNPKIPTRARIVVLCTNKRLVQALMAQFHQTAMVLHDDRTPPNLSTHSRDASWIYISTVAWEGFDLPGAKSIVIPYFPNPVPTDPAFQIFRWQRQSMVTTGSMLKRAHMLRCAWMAERAQQGVGRAIRTVADQSVVYWLDPRMPQKGYYDVLQAELPQAPWTIGPTADQWSSWLP